MKADAPVKADKGDAPLFGPFAIPDDEHVVAVTLADWGTATVCDVAVDISFDAGATWVGLATATGCFAGSKRGAIGMTFTPLPMLCAQCGNVYLPGDGRYDRALSHCDTTLKQGKSVTEMRTKLPTKDRTASVADYRMRIMLDANDRDIDADYLDRVFHTPTPVAVGPRQLRVTVTPDGPLTTTLTVASDALLPAAPVIRGRR